MEKLQISPGCDASKNQVSNIVFHSKVVIGQQNYAPLVSRWVGLGIDK